MNNSVIITVSICSADDHNNRTLTVTANKPVFWCFSGIQDLKQSKNNTRKVRYIPFSSLPWGPLYSISLSLDQHEFNVDTVMFSSKESGPWISAWIDFYPIGAYLEHIGSSAKNKKMMKNDKKDE
jgi:hypothetical protein